MNTSELFPEKPARVFRFLWIGKRGPALKTFLNVEAFSAYVREVRVLLGDTATEFRNPTLCIGVCK